MPTPLPQWYCYGVGHAFRERGSYVSPLSVCVCVCLVFPRLVSIFGLFPVLVKYDYQLILVQLCLSIIYDYPVYL